MTPGSTGWFARHEARLAWRDWLSHMTGGSRRRVAILVIGGSALLIFLHALAMVLFARYGDPASINAVRPLAIITSAMAIALSGMFSQALVLVTRAFYTRGELELVLASPAVASRLFAVRMAAIAVTVLATTVVTAAPFINVLAWLWGARWLWAYAVSVALAAIATAFAILMVHGLFRIVGAGRTRSIAQILAAVIGVAFAIGVQFIGIFLTGALNMPHWAILERVATNVDSPLWGPARAVFGEPVALAAILAIAAVAMLAAVTFFAPDFGELAVAAGSAPEGAQNRETRGARLRVRASAAALRRKEWLLLLRDPWLISQTLMQLLYLIPVGFLLWQSFSGAGVIVTVLAPMMIMVAGQIGGGLAWLALSAEDAPELIATAPIQRVAVLKAKGEAVLGGVAILLAPPVLGLTAVAPRDAFLAFCGVMVAAASSASIQYWFRIRTQRSQFRRRHTSSRLALFAESVVTTGWAGAGGLAIMGNGLAVMTGLLVLLILFGAWLMSPRREAQDL